MKSNKDIQLMLSRYFEGETTLEEEEILREFFSGKDIPEALQSYAHHFQFFKNVQVEQASDIPDDEDIISGIQAGERSSVVKMPTNTSSQPWTKFAAGLALLTLGFAVGMMVNNIKEIFSEEIAFVEDNSRNIMLLAGLNNQSSASERILAISGSLKMKDINQEIVQALIKSMNYDNNVNVRLAAIEALSHYTDRDDVRQSLIRSLEIQDQPMVQIALIDLLVDLEEKKAVNEIKRLMIDENTPKIVKQRAEMGVALLM